MKVGAAIGRPPKMEHFRISRREITTFVLAAQHFASKMPGRAMLAPTRSHSNNDSKYRSRQPTNQHFPRSKITDAVADTDGQTTGMPAERFCRSGDERFCSGRKFEAAGILCVFQSFKLHERGKRSGIRIRCHRRCRLSDGQREIFVQAKVENRRNTLCISRFSKRRHEQKESMHQLLSQTAKRPACPQKGFADQAARDFVPGESLKLQEYFVYFKASNCTNGAKDPAHGGKAFQGYA